MDIRELQGYASFFMTIFLVVALYGYIVYLYRSEKKGEKDYEKLGNIALDDEIDSTPVNSSDPSPDEKKERNK
ncbi:cytochrome c oxidase, cbb3-type, CcoQ subunit [Sulfurovum sp. NBC37-1]|uniref:cytochrome c oxidase, cbb3-type, CcoQ subunit n=1 Tax=Sulfurovum sp. (strain NBC37-1) TaxID=387093 RepID=UPI00015874A5|nr:cytochrome c oxidase, cbb3-type, CcoQ subunit [Sulfurovum sp. NBC37-1]BAF71140.1 cytochrome c oxidase, cbb3-type, subunit IV [Sulfurovum sp. NBC37-1]